MHGTPEEPIRFEGEVAALDTPITPGRHQPGRAKRLVIPAVKLFGGVWLGAQIGSDMSCTDTELGGLPATVCTDISPLDWNGGANLDFGLVENLKFPDTHTGPFDITVEPEALDFENPAIRRLTNDPESLESSLTALLSDFRDDIEPSINGSLTRGVLGFIAGNAAVWMAVAGLTREKDRTDNIAVATSGLMRGIGAGVAASVLVGGISLVTRNDDPLESAYPTGLLSQADDISLNIRDAVNNFEDYGRQIGERTRYAYEVYRTAGNLPVMPPREDTVRAMIISDRHLNTSIDPMLLSIAAEADIDVVLDAGDDSDYGSPVEYASYEILSEFEDKDGRSIPVLWVKGNHERPDTVDHVASLDNVTVLDGQVEEIDGLGFIGMGDPRYSPSPNQKESSLTPFMQDFADDLAEAIEEQDAEVAIVHDNNIGRSIAERGIEVLGAVAAGHSHERKHELIENNGVSTNLHIEGSTGAEGARALEGDQPGKVQFSILTLDKTTGRVVAGELITADPYSPNPTIDITSLPQELLYIPPEEDAQESQSSTDIIGVLRSK